MKLKTALTVIVSFTFLVFIVLAASLIHFSSLLNQEAIEMATAAESVRIHKDLKNRLLIHNRNAFLYVLHRNPDRLKSKALQRAEIGSLVMKIDQIVAGTEAMGLMDNLKEKVNSYFAIRDRLNRSNLSSVEQYNQISETVDNTIVAIDRLADYMQIQMATLSNQIQRQNLVAKRLAVILFILGGAILSILFLVMINTIARPLAALRSVVIAYGDGKNAVRARIAGLRETREIAAQFNAMADRLEARRKDQLQFISAVAHDLRNPLNAISMACELMTEEQPDSRELAGIISRQIKNLDRQLGDLLDTTRIEEGRLQLEPSEQDLCSLLNDAVDLYRNTSEFHQFSISLPESSIFCFCDSSRISQVIHNLLSNAVKYSPHGGKITIKARQDRAYAIISVSDQGIGIASKDLESIFRPFNRSSMTKGTIPGIGLGLSTSRKIVEAHGGTLSVQSVEGEGSTFSILLPIREAKATGF